MARALRHRVRHNFKSFLVLFSKKELLAFPLTLALPQCCVQETSVSDPSKRALCDLAALPPGTTAAFPEETPGAPGLFAVHGPSGIAVYVNACPHLGVNLDWLPGKFVNADATRIVCATHGAEFLIDTGQCMRGPCKGEFLTQVPCTVQGAVLMVPADAGR